MNAAGCLVQGLRTVAQLFGALTLLMLHTPELTE